ncbi:hypothetical protein [Sphingomonas flavescens]|nr:hypothetical protein [Sphingomonas limnosediminicola]
MPVRVGTSATGGKRSLAQRQSLGPLRECLEGVALLATRWQFYGTS